MTTTQTPNPDRLDQLMVDAATEGLSPQDQAELSAAVEQDPRLAREAEAYELAATAAELALSNLQADESLPAELRAKLIASAPEHLPASNAAGLKLVGTPAAPGSQAAAAATPTKFSWSDGRAFGWYAATAALIALCVVLLQPNTGSQPSGVADNGNNNTGTTPKLTEAYAELAKQPATVSAAWGFAGGDADERYADATGEVIWNSETQTGYMKLAGMPVNNPTELQYQLWIVDASRDTDVENTNRVDGGVFDIKADGEVIVPINAKLVAREAIVFAIIARTRPACSMRNATVGGQS